MSVSIQKIAALHRAAEFSVGDTVLYGKYKNQRGKVIRFFDDERGIPSVEIEPVPKGRKQNKTLGLYRIWKTKDAHQKQACVVFSTKCDGNIMLGKVRDRMYDPEVCVYHLEVGGTEICIMFDRTTGFCEGINEHGLAIVNSSLMVLQDEREGISDGDSDPERSPDGIKIVKALSKRTIPEALRTLITYKPKRFQRGLKGHTLVSDGTEIYALENTRIHTPKVLKLAPDEVHTRTNHGIYYPGAGYTKGDDYISSIVRQWESKKQLEKIQRAEDLMPALTQGIEKADSAMSPMRFTDKMRTTSQMVANPQKGEMLLYLVPGHSKFEGVRNFLPNGRKPKMKVRVFKYPSKGELKNPYVTVPDEMESASAKKSLRRQVMAERVAARALQADKLPGGLADEKTPEDFDAKQLAKGLKVEMEHTDDRAVAREVAMDHLTEDSKYYDKLETIEKHGARYKSKKTVKKQDGGDMTVYEYSDRQVADRNRKKAERLETLRKSMAKLQTKVRKDVQSKDEKVCDVALAVGLMDETFERVGNPGSAKEGHFGVTTWRVKHVKFGKSGATITYVGKSGVDQKKKITNARIVGALKKVCKDKSGDDCVLSVSAADVNKYLKSFGISAKDIRGFHANTEMKFQLKKIRKGKLPADPKEKEQKLKDEFKTALEATAESVGHEANTLKNQYLVPGMETDYMRDGTVNESHTKKGARVSYNLRQAAERGTSTERRILANAVNAPVLVVRERTWWLREAPNLYRIAREHEKVRPTVAGLQFDPQVFSVLWYEDADGNNLGEPKYFDRDPPQEPEGAKYQYSQFPNILHDSILRLNEDGTSTAVMEGNRGFPEDLVTAMVRTAEWDVGDAIMVAAQSCERCLNVLCQRYLGADEGYKFGSAPYWDCGTRCKMCDHINNAPEEALKQATKSYAEKEDENVQKMLRKEPKKKPPRYDLRNNRTLEEEDEDLEGLGAGDKGDRDLSLKWNKVGHRVAFQWLAAPAIPSSVRVRLYREAEAQTAPPAEGGSAKQEVPKFDEWVKDRRWPSKAENAAPGAEIGFRGLESQDPNAASKVREDYKRQFPSADDKGDKGDKAKEDEPKKERTREDIDADFQSARDDQDELQDTVEEVQHQIAESKKSIKALKQKLQKPEVDPSAKKKEIQTRLNEMMGKARGLVPELKTRSEEIDGISDKRDDLKKSIKADEQRIEELKKAFDRPVVKPGEKQDKIQSRIVEEMGKVEETEAGVEKLHGELDDLEEKSVGFEKSKRELKTLIKDYEKNISLIDKSHPAVEKMQDAAQEARRELREVSFQSKRNKKEVTEKTKRMEDLRQQTEDGEKLIGKLEEGLTDSDEEAPQDHDVLKTEIDSRRAKLREDQGQLKDHEESIKSKEKEHTALRAEGKQLAKGIKHLEAQKGKPGAVPESHQEIKEKIKEERTNQRKLQDELGEKKEDVKAGEEHIKELKAERQDPTGTKRKKEETKKKERAKRVREAITQTTKSMESMLGKGSGLPRETKAQIEIHLDGLSEDEVVQFSLEFDSTLKELTKGNPTSEESVSIANAMAKSGFSAEGLSSPEELAERVAKIAYTRNVVANPMITGGRPVGQSEMDSEQQTARALEGYAQFRNLNSILRREAARNIEGALRSLDPETNKAVELKSILEGINMAHVVDSGESLPGKPQPSKGSAALIRQMAETGNAAQMLGPVEDFFADASRKGMRQALENMEDDEVADFIIGDDPKHPFHQLRTMFLDKGAVGSEYKQMIKSFLVDDWMNDVWGDRAVRDVMEAAGDSNFDDPEARAGILAEAKAHGGPRREQAAAAMVRIDEARARGERPTPEDEQLVQQVLGEGGEGLRETAKGLLDTLQNKFDKWVISPATAVYKNFVETGDKSVMDTETLPHPDEAAPEPRTREQREKAKGTPGTPGGVSVPPSPEKPKEETQRRQEKLKALRQKLKDQRSKASPEQRKKLVKLKALRQKLKAQRSGVSPAQRERVQAQMARVEKQLLDAKSSKPDDEADDSEETETSKEETQRRQEKLKALRQKLKDQRSKASPEQRKKLVKLKALRQKLKAQRSGVSPAQRERVQAQMARVEKQLLDAKSGKPDNEAEAAVDEKHGPGDVWQTAEGNWRAKNRKGAPETFKDKDKAEQYSKGKETPETTEDEEFSADFNIPVEESGPSKFAADKVADLWLARVRAIHPDDPNRPKVLVEAA